MEQSRRGRRSGGGRILLAVLGAVLCSATHGAADFGDAWNWPLPPRMFGALSQGERVQYSRAEDLLKKGNYDSAAIEFEKFTVQSPTSRVKPHALLLQAYSLHLAKQRNKAIGLYTELLDFYAESPDCAVPAAYLKARAQRENGNAASGIQTLEAVVEEERNLQHPLADVVLNQLGAHYAASGNEKRAEQCWEKVTDLFADAFIRPEGAVKEARQRLTDLYVMQRRYEALETLLEKAGPSGEPRTDDAKASAVFNRAMARFGQLDPKAREAFFKWFSRQADAYEARGQAREYLSKAMDFALKMASKEQWRPLAAEGLRVCEDGLAVGDWDWLVGKISDATRAGWQTGDEWKAFSAASLAAGKALSPDQQVRAYAKLMAAMRCPLKSGAEQSEFHDVLIARSAELYESFVAAQRDAGLAALVDRLSSVEQFSRAHGMAERIADPTLATWKKIDVLGKEKKWADMAKACEELEAMDTSDYAGRSLRIRAGLYKDHLARYEEAVKLYAMISDPPATIWATIDCYEKLGKPQEAVNACSEIENFFEKDAARAGMRKALIWERASDRAKAIAACRAVLKKYPKQQASSQAHQMLERYGIATGGGVIESE